MTTIIIPAGGEQERWGGMGAKQMVDVAGEPLLARTLRQVRTYSGGAAPRIEVLAWRPEIINLCPEAWMPAPAACLDQALLGTVATWGGRTVVLLGDVCFSDQVVYGIMDWAGPLRFFGTDYELFGLSCPESNAANLKHYLEAAARWFERGVGRGKLWECLRVSCNQPVAKHNPKLQHGAQIRVPGDDWTTDFDTWRRYQEFLADPPAAIKALSGIVS